MCFFSWFICGFMAGQEDVVENLWRKFFSDPLQWWDNRSEKVKVNQLPFNSHWQSSRKQDMGFHDSWFALPVCCCTKLQGIDAHWSGGWDLRFLWLLGKSEVSWFHTQENTGGTLAWWQFEPCMGDSQGGCSPTRDCTIKRFFLEYKACKIRQGWSI